MEYDETLNFSNQSWLCRYFLATLLATIGNGVDFVLEVDVGTKTAGKGYDVKCKEGKQEEQEQDM